MDDWITSYDDAPEPGDSDTDGILIKKDSNAVTRLKNTRGTDGNITHQPELSNQHANLKLDLAAA